MCLKFMYIFYHDTFGELTSEITDSQVDKCILSNQFSCSSNIFYRVLCVRGIFTCTLHMRNV